MKLHVLTYNPIEKYNVCTDEQGNVHFIDFFALAADPGDIIEVDDDQLVRRPIVSISPDWRRIVSASDGAR